MLSLAAPVARAEGDINVVCSAPIAWCEAIAATFQKQTGITVNITLKDAGDAFAQLAAERTGPRLDVWYAGNGGSHLQAAEDGLTDEYRSPALSQLHEWAVRQAEQSRFRSVGIYASALGIGFNSKALAGKRLPEPRCWADLAKPDYRGEVQMPNPMTSGTAYVTLATRVQIMGEDKAFEWLKALHRNAGTYPRTDTGAIRAAARGETTIGVTFLHDGVTEVANGFPIRLVAPCEGTGYAVGAMSIVSGAPHWMNAKRFYEWALTPAAQKIGSDTRHFQMPSNTSAPASAAPRDLAELKLIRYDFVKYGSAPERKRLLEKWDRDVHAQPR